MDEFLRTLGMMGFLGISDVHNVRDRYYHKRKADNGRWIVTVGGTAGNTTWLFDGNGRYIQNAHGDRH